MDPLSSYPGERSTISNPTALPGIQIQPGLALAGRARELAVLRARIEAARSGTGAIALLVGEPGIGKTHIARALTAEVRAGGGIAIWGRAFESEWAPPYSLWIDALGDLYRGLTPDQVRANIDRLGSGGASLAGLLPFAAGADNRPPAPDLAPDEERYRLHEAVTGALMDASSDRPVLIVLDDLQWADPASLLLVRHLSRALPRAGIVVVATLRDTPLDREAHSNQLTALLAALHREPSFVRLPIGGLEREDVAAILTELAARPVSAALSDAVHGETGGNPFYAVEVMRHLLDEDRLTARNDAWTADLSFRELGVPEGVRQVVARRLSRLSDDAQTILGLTSVFSSGAQVEVLHALSGLPEPDLLDALDEALAAGLIRPVPGRDERYDFTHAIIRHALYEGRSRARRARLHRQVAEALERVHGARARDHAAELAAQYHASAALPGAENGIQYAVIAAEQARASFARAEAVAALRLGTDLAAGADAAIRADVLSRRAIAEADALLLVEASQTIAEALDAHEAAGSPPETVAAFLESVSFALKSNNADSAVWLPLVKRGIELSAPAKDLTWARLHLILDPIEPVTGTRFKAGIWRGFDPEAVRIARERGGEEDHARTLESFDQRTRAETDALLALARTWSKPGAKMRALTVAANDLQYRHGAFRHAAAVWEDLRSLSERYGAISWEANALTQLTFIYLTLGEIERARTAERTAIDLLSRLGPYRESDLLATEMDTSFAWYLDGDWAAFSTAWNRFITSSNANGPDFSQLGGPLYAAIAAYTRALAANKLVSATDRAFVGEAIDLVRRLLPQLPNQNQNGVVAFLGAAVWEFGLEEHAQTVDAFVRAVQAGEIGDYPQTSLDLTRARMAALRGDLAAATTNFARARETLDASGQRPLRAIVDYDEAQALIRQKGDALLATELLAAAQAAFTELGLTVWDSRAKQAQADLEASTTRPLFPAGLTEREMDVLRLVGRGYSDRQISDALYISPRTVNAHLRNMFAKATVNNRTELSVWAAAQGLLDSAPSDI